MNRSMLGSTVRDSITGLTGTVVSHTAYLHGTDGLGVQAAAVNGKNPPIAYVDIDRAQVVTPSDAATGGGPQ